MFVVPEQKFTGSQCCTFSPQLWKRPCMNGVRFFFRTYRRHFPYGEKYLNQPHIRIFYQDHVLSNGQDINFDTGETIIL